MEKVVIGYIPKTHGVKGEVKVILDTYDEGIIKKLKTVYVGSAALDIENVRAAHGFFIVKFKGVENIEDCKDYIKKQVLIDKKYRSKLPQGMHYVSDLKGCMVYAGEKLLGEVTDILQHGAADVYVVKGQKDQSSESGQGNECVEMMFPALEKVLLDIDIENKTIKVDIDELEKVVVR